MSKYMEEKAKAKAIELLTFLRVDKYEMKEIPFETEEDLKQIRSYFHSLGKTNFNKNHAEIIPFLNENLMDIVNSANNITQEQLEFEKENYLKEKQDELFKKYSKHPDWILACNMFHEVFNLYADNQLKIEEDKKIIEALIGNCKFEEYEHRILMKRLYARNINEKFYTDGKRTLPLENVFKNKILSI